MAQDSGNAAKAQCWECGCRVFPWKNGQRLWDLAAVGKNPGLSHPLEMDLGIFDSWCFCLSWKTPREVENEGSEFGNLRLDLV